MTGDGVARRLRRSARCASARRCSCSRRSPIPPRPRASRCACAAGCMPGVAERRDNDFFGGAVNRAARIMSAAHGGQVLLSQAVATLVGERLPPGVTLRDLGAVRLRDLASPERVYQLLHPRLRQDFPALRSLEATPNNLPQQVTLVHRSRARARRGQEPARRYPAADAARRRRPRQDAPVAAGRRRRARRLSGRRVVRRARAADRRAARAAGGGVGARRQGGGGPSGDRGPGQARRRTGNCC